ncbi:unnamed protein product [Blepharisma stoltei]|uniref:CCHC-type domain-containing protein n=1 Tax=Blepharisma stoltei TaxID=1481888 RepID=A0AAU9IVZ0_9CILI|nr:unnamed protein product [Blepharisma stoltei]
MSDKIKLDSSLFYIDNDPPTVENTQKASITDDFSRNTRYFDDPDPCIKCFRCSQFGHMSFKCPNEAKRPPCIFCTKSTHQFSQCEQMICYKCQGVGHFSRDCRTKFNKVCNNCGREGHSVSFCLTKPEPIREKDEKKYQCIYCNEKGHINCYTIEKAKKAISSFSCNKCGSKGHNAKLCPGVGKSPEKRDLFKQHVKEAKQEIPETHKGMNRKEKHYWKKVEQKAFKMLLKRAKCKKRNKTKKSS